MFSLETQPVWGTLQCHEAMTLILYSGLAILSFLVVPRWMRWKIDTLFLQAVSRKARERQQNPTPCYPAECNSSLLQVGNIPAEEVAMPEGGLGDHQYADEREDPDYMALQDNGCGDYIVRHFIPS